MQSSIQNFLLKLLTWDALVIQNHTFYSALNFVFVADKKKKQIKKIRML